MKKHTGKIVTVSHKGKKVPGKTGRFGGDKQYSYRKSNTGREQNDSRIHHT